MPGGRPTKYTEELAIEFCSRLVDGTSVRTICKQEDMPASTTVFRWLAESMEFREQYEQAKEMAAEALAEECFDIADDGTNDWMEMNDRDGECIGYKVNGEALQRSRLRVDTRKWYLSKIKAKKYGEKQQIEQTTTHKFSNVDDDELDSLIETLKDECSE